MEDSNRSSNPTIHDVSDPQRRIVLRGALGAALAALYPPFLGGCAAPATCAEPQQRPDDRLQGHRAGFERQAHRARGLRRAADRRVGRAGRHRGNMPAFKPDASNTAAEQAVQMGMHHDGMHYYALDGSSTRGLLCMNHEYTDDGLLHSGGMSPWTAEKVRKAQAAHGISVTEWELKDGKWQMVRPSKYARPHHREHAVHGRVARARDIRCSGRPPIRRVAPCSARSRTAPPA
jgi:secreted PhoX family phosphatase